MKLLHINNNLERGGAEMLIHNLAILQKSFGIEVAVLLLTDSNTFLKKDLIEKGIPVYALQPVGKSVRNPLNIFRIIPYLRKYDVIHVHVFPAQYWAAFAHLSSFSKVPMITTEHNTTNGRRTHFFLRLVDRFIYKRIYKSVVACSNDALLSLNAYSPKSNNTFISNGVDVFKFYESLPYSKEKCFGLPDDSFIISMVARFQPQKRQELLIKSLRYLPLNVHVAFCGVGETKENCEKIAKENGVDKRVLFFGIRNDVDRILKTSDLVALISNFEGLSLSSIEGMSVGKPFVASRVNGLTSLVDGAGVLVDNDPKNIVEAIIRLMNDKSYYDDVALKCFERAKQYDIRITEYKYRTLYNIVA